MTLTTKLGKYFTLGEMLKTSHAELQQTNIDKCTPAIRDNLRRLVINILDPLREKVSQPLIVSSGFRCPALNKAVKGSATSQHMLGEAADIQGSNLTNAELFALVQKLNLPYDQLIWEYGTKENPDWVHISFSKRNRKQILFIGLK